MAAPCAGCLIAHYCQENFGKSGCLRTRAALRDKAKAEKIVLDNCADCEFDRACRDKTCPAYQIHAAAARIAKRKAAK